MWEGSFKKLSSWTCIYIVLTVKLQPTATPMLLQTSQNWRCHHRMHTHPHPAWSWPYAPLRGTPIHNSTELHLEVRPNSVVMEAHLWCVALYNSVQGSNKHPIFTFTNWRRGWVGVVPNHQEISKKKRRENNN